MEQHLIIILIIIKGEMLTTLINPGKQVEHEQPEAV
jgi:hypothetical protein